MTDDSQPPAHQLRFVRLPDGIYLNRDNVARWFADIPGLEVAYMELQMVGTPGWGKAAQP